MAVMAWMLFNAVGNDFVSLIAQTLSLPTSVERLDISATNNALANLLTGNAASNVLMGGTGALPVVLEILTTAPMLIATDVWIVYTRKRWLGRLSVGDDSAE